MQTGSGCTGTAVPSMGYNFQIQTDKLVMSYLLDVVVVNKQQTKAVVIDVAIPRQQ